MINQWQNVTYANFLLLHSHLMKSFMLKYVTVIQKNQLGEIIGFNPNSYKTLLKSFEIYLHKNWRSKDLGLNWFWWSTEPNCQQDHRTVTCSIYDCKFLSDSSLKIIQLINTSLTHELKKVLVIFCWPRRNKSSLDL